MLPLPVGNAAKNVTNKCHEKSPHITLKNGKQLCVQLCFVKTILQQFICRGLLHTKWKVSIGVLLTFSGFIFCLNSKNSNDSLYFVLIATFFCAISFKNMKSIQNLYVREEVCQPQQTFKNKCLNEQLTKKIPKILICTRWIYQ